MHSNILQLGIILLVLMLLVVGLSDQSYRPPASSWKQSAQYFVEDIKNTPQAAVNRFQTVLGMQPGGRTPYSEYAKSVLSSDNFQNQRQGFSLAELPEHSPLFIGNRETGSSRFYGRSAKDQDDANVALSKFRDCTRRSDTKFCSIKIRGEAFESKARRDMFQRRVDTVVEEANRKK